MYRVRELKSHSAGGRGMKSRHIAGRNTRSLRPAASGGVRRPQAAYGGIRHQAYDNDVGLIVRRTDGSHVTLGGMEPWILHDLPRITIYIIPH